MGKQLLKFCKNEYLITVIVFLVWILFIDEVSLPKYVQQKMNNKKIIEEIETLNRQTLDLERWLKYRDNKDSIEKFARENYRMKRSNEVIYIFD